MLQLLLLLAAVVVIVAAIELLSLTQPQRQQQQQRANIDEMLQEIGYRHAAVETPHATMQHQQTATVALVPTNQNEYSAS